MPKQNLWSNVRCFSFGACATPLATSRRGTLYILYIYNTTWKMSPGNSWLQVTRDGMPQLVSTVFPYRYCRGHCCFVLVRRFFPSRHNLVTACSSATNLQDIRETTHKHENIIPHHDQPTSISRIPLTHKQNTPTTVMIYVRWSLTLLEPQSRFGDKLLEV